MKSKIHLKINIWKGFSKMNYILKNAEIFKQGKFQGTDIFIKDGSFFDISKNIFDTNATVIDCKNLFIFSRIKTIFQKFCMTHFYITNIVARVLISKKI